MSPTRSVGGAYTVISEVIGRQLGCRAGYHQSDVRVYSWEAGAYLQQSMGKVHPGQVAKPSQGNTQTTIHTLIHAPKARPINLTGMYLDCGRKLEYPVRTHACTGRTCKLHAERPEDGNRTQDLIAARQQCYQLHHRAAYINNHV
ncbi:hypothetical protein ATANTOWER_019367 [Ataeniobius toweri]|uniref:Uncharacterized protein n=1 Tax=Ataeniobius toweri TaxID=208326 RepID=A0ABU7CHI2_9TELE|nr:hypothetical protein [Ataeniobius toweri]